jgi:hypothetical protein
MFKSVSKWMGLVLGVAIAGSAAPAWSQNSASAPPDSASTATLAAADWSGGAGTSDTGKELGIYMWLAGIDGTIGAGQAKNVAVDAKFTDLAQYLDFSIAGYFEIRRPKYILGTDLFWVNLGATRTAHINGSNVDVDLNFKQTIGALGGAYRLTPKLDLWLTGRLYALKTSQTFQGVDQSSHSKTWGDVYVGARYHLDLGERWVVVGRADVGAGGSNLAVYGNLAVGYQFTPMFTLGAAYRVLSLDYEDTSDGYFKYDIIQDGLGIVANFSLK